MGFWPVVINLIRESDIIVLVGDVRMPELSKNKALEELISKFGKHLVSVFTKIDLVSDIYLEKIRNKYKDAFFVSGTRNIGINNLKIRLLILAKRLKIKMPRIAIVGYPNIGKSAIINALVKRARAKVSAHAGTTRGIQWIKSSGFLLFDSPGVIPYNDGNIALGILGSKNPEKLNNVERVADEIVKMFVNYDKNVLEEAYGIRVGEEYSNILEEIAGKKGFLLKGGVVDERRAALLILRDWQKGKLRL